MRASTKKPAVPPNDGPSAALAPGDQALAAFASRLRATSAAAAAPNSNIIGGAGTGAGEPPLEPVLPPELPDDELLDDDELELDDEPPSPPPVELVLDEPFDEKPPVDDQPSPDEL